MKIWKQFPIEIKEIREDGGRIRINTGAVDRQKDRVMPSGVQIEDYMRNPVVQWGHNYHEPWATIGRTNSLEVSEDGIIADFTLRPAANEHDPQHIVRLLWNGQWVNAASVGFMADEWEENEHGGRDFNSWMLWEWSLVPIPANQEALRLAVKAMGEDEELSRWTIGPANTSTVILRGDELGAEAPLAWIRRLTVETDPDKHDQVVFAAFHAYEIDIPKDATILDCDEEGGLVETPHPDAGKTVARKSVCFVPPIEFWSEKWGEDAAYSISGPPQPDEELVKAGDGAWKVLDLSDVVVALPVQKGWYGDVLASHGIEICQLTKHRVDVAQRMIQRRLGRETKDVSAIPYSAHGDSASAPEERSWDGNAARTRLREWAGGDEWDAAKYRKGFALLDGEPDMLGSYKGPHHDIVDGSFAAVWRGVNAAMGSLVFGARGGRVADEDVRKAVYSHLGKHYDAWDKPVPEFREYDEAELKELFPACWDTQEEEISGPEELDALAGEVASLREQLEWKMVQQELTRLKEVLR